MKAVHSGKLERWLGAETCEQLSRSVRDWYAHPIPVAGVPGEVYAARGGDFVGHIACGSEMSSHDRLAEIVKRERRRRVAAMARGRKQLGAFGSLDAIMAAATAGKYQDLKFNKTGVAANAVGQAMDMWTRAGYPAAGVAAGASPGGVAPGGGSAGIIPLTPPATTNSLQPMSAWLQATVAPNSLLMYDRIFAVAKLMNSTATEAVTGAPGRYQNTVSGAVDSAVGSFYFPSVPTTVLAATAHNWVTCKYTNSAGIPAQSSPSQAGIASCVVGGVDLAVNSWFMPLTAGDLGVQKIDQMQCSALVATGTVDFVIGHALAFMACPIALLTCQMDYVYTAFRAVKILDNAALAFLEMPKPAVTATSYIGGLYAVAE